MQLTSRYRPLLQLAAELVGNPLRIDFIRNNVGSDKDQKLGLGLRGSLILKQQANPGISFRNGTPVSSLVRPSAIIPPMTTVWPSFNVTSVVMFAILDQGTGYPGRRISQGLAHFLGYIQVDPVAGMDDRFDGQQDAGLAVLDRLQNTRRTGILDRIRRSLAGDDRDLGTHFDLRFTSALGQDPGC